MRTGFLITLISLTSCGSNEHTNDAAIDAAIDAAVEIDAVTLDCDSYCTVIQANCTGSNAQYGGADSAAAFKSCKQTCESFVKGTSIDETAGNTLGCRLHYALEASSSDVASASCAKAGPAGDAIMASSPAFCSGGDPCMIFCTIEIRACGLSTAPLPGDPRDENNNSLYQYRTMDSCIVACRNVDNTHAYSTSARGDSLACRLYQATQAVISVVPDGVTFCRDTTNSTVGRCDGPAMP